MRRKISDIFVLNEQYIPAHLSYRIYKILIAVVFLFSVSPFIYAQETSINNNSGNWTTNSTWVDNSAPGVTNITPNITIYGTVKRIGSLDFGNGDLNVYDTLLIFGNLTLGNNADLTIQPGGVLIVYGNYTSGNQVVAIAGGYFVVTGEFLQQGANNQGSFDITTGQVFLLDPSPVPKTGGTYTDLNCTDPNNYPANCGFGNESNLNASPIGTLFSTGPYTLTLSGPVTFCTGGSVVLSVPNDGNTYQWYRDGVPIGGATTFSYTANSSGNYYLTFIVAGQDITTNTVTVTVNTLSTAPASASSDRNNICPADGNIILSYAGGTIGNGATAQWYSDPAFTVNVGSGNNLSIATPIATTTYYVRFEGPCNTTSGVSATVTIIPPGPVPTITLSGINSFPAGTTSLDLPYTATTGSPLTYSINWDASALSTGFANVVDAGLPVSPVSITIPAGAIEGGVYSGNFLVKNYCGVSSINYPIVVRIMARVLGTSTYPVVAYSLRKLTPSYTGPAVRISRVSDGELRDVYFDGSDVVSLNSQISAAGGGAITPTLLSTWIGAGSATIQLWFDQSNNNQHASQATVAFMPLLINNGIINLVNSRPAPLFDGTNDLLTYSNPPTDNFSIFTIARTGVTHQIDPQSNSSTTGTAGQRYLMGASQQGVNAGQGISMGTNGISNYEHGNSYMPPTAVYSGAVSGLNLVDVLYSVRLPRIYLNGDLVRTGLISARPIVYASNQIGSGPYGAFSGEIPEIIIFPSALSDSERNSIECNQSTFYGISLNTPSLTIPAVPILPYGTASVNVPYAIAAGNPVTYSISWDAASLASGFANVNDAPLTASPLVITIPPGAAAGGTYVGTFTFKNACGLESVQYPVTLGFLNQILGINPLTFSSAAYSIRKLTPSYAGPALRVRRSSDNTEQDINFTGSGDLDQVALLAFVSGSDGYVSIWYDQSGFGRNATQATLSKQALLVSGGVLNLVNGQPALKVTGAQSMLSALKVNQSVGAGITSTFNSVFISESGQNQSLISGNGNEYNIHAPWGDGNTYFDVTYPAGRLTGALSWNDLAIGTFRRDGAQSDVWKNGKNVLTSSALNATATFSANAMNLFAYSGNTYYMKGSVPEMIFFSSSLSAADRQIIECNQSSYYSIPQVPAGFDFYIQANKVDSGCTSVTENVVWNASDLVNLNASGNDLIKTRSSGNWDGGAASFNKVGNNGFMEFIATETNSPRMVGLSNTNVNSNWNTINYAFYLVSNGSLEIREAGSGNLIGAQTYATGDILRISVENNRVRYYKNGLLLYISNQLPVLPLLVDVSIYSINGTISDVVVSNNSNGIFTAAIINAGGPVTYQWKLNGSNVGIDSDTYTNTSLVLNDEVSCDATITGSCGLTTVSSNLLINNIPSSYNGIASYIEADDVVSACLTATEDVVWNTAKLFNVTATGNDLVKIQSSGWNGGASSLNKVNDNGYLEFTASETTTQRMVGLSSTDLNSNWTSIRYLIFLNNSSLEIRENGSGSRIGAASFSSGDVFRISVEQGVIKYYQNGTLLYISALAPTLPLIADVSIDTNGGTVTDAIISNMTIGAFTAIPVNAGANPIYQWKRNGVNTGANSVTYSNASLAENDLISCDISSDLPGCTSTFSSPPLTIRASIENTSIDFFVKGTTSASACQTAQEEVVWEKASLFNLNANGNSLSKIQSNGTWDGGAASLNRIADNGYFEFVATETNMARMAGLSTVNTNTNWNTITYAIYLVNNGTVEIRESASGNLIGARTYSSGDTFRIGVENGEVKYYQNGTLFYISTVAPTLPLLVDVSLRDVSATITNAIVSNFSTGIFTATAVNAGTVPVFQWKLNGTDVGTNNTTYTNTSLSPLDEITCVLTPDLGGCSIAPYESNKVIVNSVTSPASIDFFVTGDGSTSGCLTSTEQVVWNLASISNLSVSGNNLLKIQSNGNWNGAASSLNKVYNNGYFEFTVSEINTTRVAGLSTTDPDGGLNSVQFAFYLNAGGSLNIYQSGSNRGTFGSYASGDVLKISVENNVVNYYRNGILLYISSVTPTLPLLVDVSIQNTPGTVTNALITNFINGVFTATATNSGLNPAYQWKLNGVNVGTNSTNYTNTTLVDNDIISCVLTPDLGGCSSTLYTSNLSVIHPALVANSIDFYIRGSSASTACQIATEEVVWEKGSLFNVVASGNSLSKLQSNGNWDGGAASLNRVSNNGFMEFIATETNTFRMIGLSTTNASTSYTTIQYAVYLRGDLNFEIYESGAGRGTFGSYIAGDTFRIAIENNKINYYRNGSLFYISTIAPTLPMLVDVSLRDISATVTNVIVSNFSTGTFTATSVNAGAAPVYQWKLNGANVGTNSTTYINGAVIDSDVITCVLTPDLGGCSTTLYNSNQITVNEVAGPASIDFYVTGNGSTSGCQTSTEQVAWNLTSISNISIIGNDLTKIQSNGSWNGAASSLNKVYNNGYLEFTASETNTIRVVGLSTADSDGTQNSVQYAFYLNNTGALIIYQSGSNRGTFGTYVNGDILKISVENNVVKYYKNGNLLYISLVAPVLPLLADVSIWSTGGTVNNVKITNFTTGVFNAIATNAGTAPIYQWKLNGSNVGTNNPIYSNSALTENDIVSCVLTPDLGGCSSTIYTSNTSTIKSVTTASSIDFFIKSTSAASACQTITEEVVWEIASLKNLVASANSLNKVQSNGSWDGGAASLNRIYNNGYLEFVASEINMARMVGLSTTNTNDSYTSIQFAMYLRADAVLEVYESGTSRGGFGTYASGDIFRIAVVNNQIRYYKNGTVFYISAGTPALPLLVDVSLRDISATATRVIVSNFSTGVFTATAVNAGASPSYQWTLNGINTGTNSDSYTNLSLNDNDSLICILTPDLGGCASTIYTSNEIKVLALAQPASIDFYIKGDAPATGCQQGTEEVAWSPSTIGNANISGNSITKILSNGWTGGASSFNTVTNNSYLEFTASQTNTLRAIGLSNSDVNFNFNSIRYSFYLDSNGTYQIMESGNSRGTYPAYVIGDVFRIAVENGFVRYYRNGILLYISALSPSYPMIVDASLNTIGSNLSNVKVTNFLSGTFTAIATNVGASPVYQWKLNGINVGSNNTVYTNASLNSGDIVTCNLVPDFGGCSLVNYTSNSIAVSDVSAPQGIDFYIQGTSASNACQTSVEEVVWQYSALNNVISSGNNLTKIQSDGQWNGGAASLNKVYDNGYLEFKAAETNKYRMIGLSNTNANNDYQTIQFAVYLQNNGTVNIYESSVNRGGFGAYSTGDIFRIAIENGVVKYYKNNVIFYSSTVAPVLPLLADVSIYNTGGTVTDAWISNLSTGVFTATAVNAGVSPVYQWKLNGVNVGTNNPTYTNFTLTDNDTVTAELTPDLGGCSIINYTSNLLINSTISQPATIDFYIIGDLSVTGCQQGEEEVVWNSATKTNINALTNNISKTLVSGWNGGVSSFNSVTNNSYLEFTVNQNNTLKAIGLSNSDLNLNYTSIRYSFYLDSNGTYQIIESGTSRVTFPSYSIGDVFRISVESGIVRYYRNTILLYISAVVPSYPMIVDVSLNTIGSTLSNVKVANFLGGTFTATASNAGISPVYQWKLNGVNVGANNPVYINSGLLSGDIVTCSLTPDYGGCGLISYISNTIVVNNIPAPSGIDFYIRGTSAASACQNGTEEVIWSNAALVNVTSTSGLLRKIQGGNNWNGGAASFNKVENGGYFEVVATETNTSRMIGMSTTNVDGNYTTIQYAFYLRSDAVLEIYESGTSRGTYGTYATGDVLKATVENNIIRYYKNGALIYNSGVIPTLPLLVDVSLNTVNSTINNVTVTNTSTGTFIATAINAGSSPAYQWKLNGLNVGSNSSTYINTNLNDSDQVTCILTPDLNGCVTISYASNVIEVNSIAAPLTITNYILSDRVVSGCKEALEEVVWNSTGMTFVSSGPGNLTKLLSTGWNGGASSINTVLNNGYLQFTANETNTLRAIGLSNSDANLNYTSIRYCFYLASSGALQIYENGTGRGTFGTYATGDVLKIAAENGIVKYYRNNTLIYTSTLSAVFPMIVDASLNTIAGTFSGVKVSNLTTGIFTATVLNAGASPAFQWTVNSINVGSNSPNYSNVNLLNNDTVQSLLTPDIGGCGLTSYPSNKIVFKEVASPAGIDFYVLGSYAASACQKATEMVVWDNTSLVNVNSTGNLLSKFQSGGNWDGGAASFNRVYDNGYLELIASETNTSRMIGLSNTNANTNYTSIKYAFYLVNGGSLQIYESGVSRGSYGTYTTGTVLRITASGTTVRYYKNGTLLYTSPVAATYPMLVDVSIFSLSGTLNNVTVTNNNAGTFSAIATNAGASPFYQWKLNGVNVGTNSATYSNTSLVNSDLITCTLTPDILGCGPVSVINSNSLTIGVLPDAVLPAITCPSDISSNVDAGLCYANLTISDPLYSDNCGVQNLTWSISGSTTANSAATGINLIGSRIFNTGVNNVSYTVTDYNGNVRNCLFTVTVIDNIPPAAICRNISVDLGGTGTATIVAADLDNGSTDNCGISGMAASQTSFDYTNLGANSVTLTVTDVNGNSSDCVATVTVTGALNIPPTSASVDRNNLCPADGNIVLSYTGGLLVAGSTAEWYSDAAFTVNIGSGNNITIATPLSTLTYYVRFEGPSNTTSAQSVTITINPLPVVTLAAFANVCVDAADFALSGGLPAGGTYTGTGVTAGSFSPATAGTGTHTITYTYTDGNSCVNSATRTITVNALPTPSISGPTDVCVPSTENFLVTSVPGNSYNWVVSGGSISGASTNNSVMVDWVASGTGTVEVTETILSTGCNVTTPVYNVTLFEEPAIMEINSSNKLTRR